MLSTVGELSLASVLKEAYRTTPLQPPLIALINSYISSFIFPGPISSANGELILHYPPREMSVLPRRVTSYFTAPEMNLHVAGDQGGAVFLFLEPDQWITVRKPELHSTEVLVVSILKDGITLLVVDKEMIELYDLRNFGWVGGILSPFAEGAIFLNQTRDHLFQIKPDEVIDYHFLEGRTVVKTTNHRSRALTASGTEDTVAVIEERENGKVICYRWLENWILINEHLFYGDNLNPSSLLTSHAFYFWQGERLVSHTPNTQCVKK